MGVDSVGLSDNSLFFKIIDALIKFGGDGATMVSLSQEIGVREQNIYYHIPKLISTGMIYKDGNKYYPQAILVNTGLREYISAAMNDIIEYILADSNCAVFIEGADEDDVSDAMENCIKTLIFRELI
jgi:predicted transcriptional regulator